MKIEDRYIIIEVTPTPGAFSYEYDAYIGEIGNPDDSPGSAYCSMWSWINHLRKKIWWNKEKEEEFKLLANKIIYG